MRRADKTFTDEDIIRLFQNNLDNMEKTLVLEHFMDVLALRPGDEDAFTAILEDIVAILEAIPGVGSLAAVLDIAAQVRELVITLTIILSRP